MISSASRVGCAATSATTGATAGAALCEIKVVASADAVSSRITLTGTTSQTMRARPTREPEADRTGNHWSMGASAGLLIRGREARPASDAAAVSRGDMGTSQLPSMETMPSALAQIWTGTTTSGESARACACCVQDDGGAVRLEHDGVVYLSDKVQLRESVFEHLGSGCTSAR